MQGVRYTVKQVAEATGIPSATLRAWERRYAVVEPQRSSSHYRLYDQEDVRRLTHMAELVRQGTPASLAASQVRDSLTAPIAAPPGAGPVGHGPPVAELIQAAQRYDETQLSQVLDRALAGVSFEQALEGWLLPALSALGRAWERGEVDISGEHFVSAAVQRRLSTAFDAAGPNAGAPVALVGLPPGALHLLGTMGFAVCLRRQGIDVRFLGADVPHESWEHSVAALQPAGVVISVPMPRDGAPAARLIESLQSAHPQMPLWVGGHGADEAKLAGSRHLPVSVVEAARTVSRRLHAG
ncbi:Transcriptional regulator, MerR family [Serinicoccus hydrothermalis]|uniref:Transcriptional regulator, MerR family n=1 Tax=Serinicoccus hydrothermalis TaxID=1758689 RepID=A0A1B1NCH8_9MICO|nr:MerR family transcriptional regulator [Serinicoccus hydrothermalis]ANS79126.1 Transcriptional regulator, MerR family [Serinicoccus hydrothermalis]